MITKNIKTISGKLSLSMPEKLEEVTLGQLIEMQSTPDLSDLQAVSILSCTPLAELQNIVHINDLQLFNEQVLHIAHQIKHLYQSEAIPASVSFNLDGEAIEVKVIKNLSVEPVGAFMASREVIAEEINKHIKQHGEEDWQASFSPSLQACSQLLAQYFYCRATQKPYNEHAAAEFEVMIKKLPVTQALPISKYFFLSFPHLYTQRTSFWRRVLRLLKSGRA